MIGPKPDTITRHSAKRQQSKEIAQLDTFSITLRNGAVCFDFHGKTHDYEVSLSKGEIKKAYDFIRRNN
jgi:hypothetical protein